MAVTTKTTQVMHMPTALSGSPCFHPGSRRRSQRITIPAWDMVNAMKTPDGIERDEPETSPWKRKRSRQDITPA